jgi:hypothetical protein
MAKLKTKGYKWTPLTPCGVNPPTESLIEAWMSHHKVDRAKALELMREDHDRTELWANELYQVQVRRMKGSIVHLNIRRRDGEACIRDWRHFQQIKNELLGPECEAMELYPAESRLVDSTNKYHLFGSTDPTFRFPVGFKDRDVRFEDDHGNAGLKQRPPSMKLPDKKD